MKKFLLLLPAFLLFIAPSAFATEPAKPARAILDHANDLIIQAEERAQELAAQIEGQPRQCLDTFGWSTVITSRLKLGYENFKETVTIVKDSGCLLHDTGQIETRIMRLVRLVSESQISCNELEASVMRSDIEKLFFLRDALAEYGNLTPEDEQRARDAGAHPLQEYVTKYGALPPQLQGANFALSDEVYRNDALCTEPSSFFSFHQVKEELEALLSRLEEIKEFSAGVRGVAREFSAGESSGSSFGSELSQVRQKARRHANAWFYQNIRQPIEDSLTYGFGSNGAPTLTKEEKELLRQEQKNKLRTEDAVPTPKTLAEVSEDYWAREDIHAVLRLEETKHDDSVGFLQMVSEDMVYLTEVGPEIGKHSFEPEVARLASETEEVTKFYEEVTRLTTEICAQHGSCE